MKVERNCLRCGRLMFYSVQIEDSPYMAVDIETKLELKSESGERFYVCPHCSAKNGVTAEGGSPPQLRISHIIEG